MKFIVSSSALLKELQVVNGVISSSNTLPILDNFLFEVDGKELTIRGSDVETTLVSKIQIESKEKGSVAMQAKLLLDILKSLPEQPLTFSVDPSHYGIEIVSDYGKYKLMGYEASEYPRMPEMENAVAIEVEAEVLQRAFEKTMFASANDEMKPQMSGVFCQFSTEGLTFVATDAHKLVRYRRLNAIFEENISFILPKKPISLLKNTLSGVEEKVNVRYNQTNVSFVFGKTTLICRLIEGAYPNFEAALPREGQNDKKLIVDRGAVLSCLKRVSIFSNKTTHQVKIKASGSELFVSAEDRDFSNEANERLTCNFDGSDIEIGFNSKFLIETLSNLESQDIRFELSESNRAGFLFPAEEMIEGEDILMLVMPVMLQNN